MNEKTAFIDHMETQLQAWEADLERWRAQGERADGDVDSRKEQQQMLEDLHQKRLQARHYMDDLSRGEALADWLTLKPEMERLWAEIRVLIEMIKQWA